MAFALALKSKFDYPGVGQIFLLLTLIITAFTLIYSSIMLEKTLIYCDIIIDPVEEERQKENEHNNRNDKDSSLKENFFEQIKTLIYGLHVNYLLPYVDANNSDKKAPLKEILMHDFKN
jgi:hypothetical protein